MGIMTSSLRFTGRNHIDPNNQWRASGDEMYIGVVIFKKYVFHTGNDESELASALPKP